jgi:hypothetical protein
VVLVLKGEQVAVVVMFPVVEQVAVVVELALMDKLVIMTTLVEVVLVDQV